MPLSAFPETDPHGTPRQPFLKLAPSRLALHLVLLKRLGVYIAYG